MIKMKNWPTKSRRITSPFGPRWGAFHDGLDIGAVTPKVEGDELYAVADGKVVVSKVNNGGANAGYGYYIIIQHEGFCTLYGHMQSLELEIGDNVQAGQVVGHMGNTGTSTGAHLHFRLIEGTYSAEVFTKTDDLRTKGSVNPEPFLKEIEFVPEWMQILRKSVDKPEEWIDWIEAQKGIGKFLPNLIVKVHYSKQ